MCIAVDSRGRVPGAEVLLHRTRWPCETICVHRSSQCAAPKGLQLAVPLDSIAAGAVSHGRRFTHSTDTRRAPRDEMFNIFFCNCRTGPKALMEDGYQCKCAIGHHRASRCVRGLRAINPFHVRDVLIMDCLARRAGCVCACRDSCDVSLRSARRRVGLSVRRVVDRNTVALFSITPHNIVLPELMRSLLRACAHALAALHRTRTTPRLLSAHRDVVHIRQQLVAAAAAWAAGTNGISTYVGNIAQALQRAETVGPCRRVAVRWWWC
jgi:hypothetical protein